jgi:murein DD-endopeptidase MepM/ murein hydrolase activator NlpD
MNGPSFPVYTRRPGRRKASRAPCLRSPIVRLMAWCAVLVWCTSGDWRTKCPLLARVTAHLSIIVLALAASFFVGLEIREPYVAAGGLSVANEAPFTTDSPEIGLSRGPLSIPHPSNDWSHSRDVSTVARLPVPHTIIPDRPRAQVITYTVQRGDTIFDVAAQFGLAPATIVWSNREAVRDVPWLIRAGTELLILPVDGVYHTVRSGETIASIASDYGIDPAGLYNEWNDLDRGKQPREGQQLVVPGGKGEELTWQLPPRYPGPGPDSTISAICGGTVVTGAGGHGWFTYPTGGSQVSGWYFHDPRNRMHAGLDYRCEQGDPIYAADNGVVTMAGRNGTYGMMLEVNHGEGFTTRYGHLSRIVVECGQTVYQGDLIGYCGDTGWSSGAHLHFEIRRDNVPQDPQVYLPQLGSEVLHLQ